MRLEITKHQYAQDSLHQSYELYIPELSASSFDTKPKYWLLYLHGGYYRDPKVDSASFHPTLNTLLTSPSYAHVRETIAGYAMINYRLSPHPDYPQNPDTTPGYEMRTASHPDHIIDVLAAISVLQKTYRFGDRYLLVGHSVGTTLAFQVALSQSTTWSPPDDVNDRHTQEQRHVLPPSAILGLSGIYDFPLIHRTHPTYLSLTTNALGASVETHQVASPACHDLATYRRAWSPSTQKGKQIIVLAHSHNDGLVDWSQVDAMRSVFEGKPPSQAEDEEERNFVFQVVVIEGIHDQTWKEGKEMARVIGIGVEALRAQDERGTGGEFMDEKQG